MSCFLFFNLKKKFIKNSTPVSLEYIYNIFLRSVVYANSASH